MLACGTRCNHDDRNITGTFIATNIARQIEAIHARHFNVDQHHVRCNRLQVLQCIDAVLGQHYLIAFTCQQALRYTSHCQRIIDHHHDMLSTQALHRFDITRSGFKHRHFCHCTHIGWRIRWCQTRSANILMRDTLCKRNRIQDQYNFTRTQYGRASDTDHS